MLAAGQNLSLALEHLERVYQLAPCVDRIDDVVDETTFRGKVGIGEASAYCLTSAISRPAGSSARAISFLDDPGSAWAPITAISAVGPCKR